MTRGQFPAEVTQPVQKATHAAVTQAVVAGFDETGLQIAGQPYWLHVVGTPTLTYCAIHTKRGQTAMDAIGILPVFQGTAVHDALSDYFQYDCKHSLCNAHLLRDLIAVSELTRQRWPAMMIDLLLKIKMAGERAIQAGQTALSPQRLNHFTAQYRQLVRSGLRANPPPKPTGRRGRPAQGPIRSLLLRLKQQAAAVLAFMHDLRVPFDNNQAERDLRMIKVRQKISGGFRSWAGAEAFCRIRTYLSTMRKQGHNALAVLTSFFAGSPILPRLTAESLPSTAIWRVPYIYLGEHHHGGQSRSIDGAALEGYPLRIRFPAQHSVPALYLLVAVAFIAIRSGVRRSQTPDQQRLATLVSTIYRRRQAIGECPAGHRERRPMALVKTDIP